MRRLTLTGIIFAVFGVAMLACGSVSYTTEETILEVVPVEATAETREMIAIPPAVGWAAIGGGVALMLIGQSGRVSSGT